jgi:hypothetical protein
MVTGTSSRAPSPAFHADDLDQAVEYRTLSVPAILGLVLGLASPLCFGAPLLMLIPISGIAISVFALRRIAASDGALAGRWVAVAGLILCTSLAVAPLSREFVLRLLRSQQAQGFAASWLKLVVSGHAEEAFQLASDSMRGPGPPDPGKKTPPANPYDTFLGSPLVKAMSAAGADANVHFVRTESYDPQSFPRVYVRQRFEITPAAAKSDAHPVDVTLTMQRALAPKEGRSRWLVWAMEDGAKPAGASPPR